MKVFYNENYTASKYAFDTTRKSKAIVSSLDGNPIKGLTITDPETDKFTDVDGQVTDSKFSQVAIQHLQKLHDDSYFDAVLKGNPKDLAESQGFDWDEGIFKMGVAHASGLIAATYEALTNKTTAGSLSSGLHHAHLSHGAGFCTFNGLAASADYAIEAFGAERVLILDFDAHAGGGTWEIVNTYHPENVVQVDVTCAAFDTWTPEGESSIWYTGHQDYRKDIDRALVYASKKLDKFDLIIYNAGMDPLNSGVSMKDIVYRENAVREFIGDTPAIYALAGGYTWGNKTMDDVVDWHRITLETWANAQ
jgi:acetoin utilization deacetylase AcuC-like enzyme